MEEAFDEGQREDLEIEQEGPLLDIVEVIAEAFFDAGVPSIPMDLCPAGDARLDLWRSM